MAILLNGTEIKPTPLVSIQVENEFKESGKLKKSVKVITLKGKILSYDPLAGDTAITDEKERLARIHTKYAALEALVIHPINEIFINTTFSIPQLSGKAKLRSKSYQIDAGSILADYTIVFEQTLNQPEEVDESWSLDPSDEYERFVKVTRTRSITLESSETATYQLAMSKIPASSSVSEGAAYLPSDIAISASNAYNKTTSYNVNTEKNSVECTESWTISNTNTIVEDTYTVKDSSENIYKSASRQISIKGLEGSSGKYANAVSKFNQLNQGWEVGNSASIGGISGKIKTLSIGRNQINGTINVNIDISEGIEQAGEISKTIDITDNPPTDFYASIAAVGKPEGPILQKFGTKKQGTKSVNITVIYKNGSYTIPSVSEYAPSNGDFYVEKDEISYDERSGRVTRNVTWTYGGSII